MKKLLFIISIIILILSCNEEPTNVEQDDRFQTVYGIDRYLEDGTFASVIGDVSKNPCIHFVELNLNVFPNPMYSEVTLSLRTSSKLSCEIFIETAISSDDFLDSLNSLEIPNKLYRKQHDSYFKKSIYKGEMGVGQNEIMLDLNQIGTGVYYLTYEDSEGNSDCAPLVVQRYTF